MNKNSYIYDIEVFSNFWCCSFLEIDNPDNIFYYIISWDLKLDDRIKLKEFLDNKVEMLIGYNNLAYDYNILLLIYNYEGSHINKDIAELSSKLISDVRNPEGYGKYFYKEYLWKQLDLMKIMAFDKLGISLKQISINLKWHKIQDLPLPYDHVVIQEDINTILQYNINDVKISYELYKALQAQIDLRIELSDEYNVNLLSASDSKIANVLLEKIYEEETGIDISQLKKLRTKRNLLWLRDCIGKDIEFKTEKLQLLKIEIENTLVVAENNFAYNKEIEFGNCIYDLGIGGLHSQDKPGRFASDNNVSIIDADISSYYPHIIINNNIKPEHLDDNFIKILKKITKDRIEAKKTGNKIKADALKITVNSIFGKLGSETFWLEDAKAMLTVTVSGQLYLLMLIEELTLAGILVISANTDGIVCKIPKELEEKYKEVCQKWQEKTKFELEYTYYNLYIRSDINNYISRKEDNSTKEKGRFVKNIDLKRAYRYPIIPFSIYEYFINNVPVEKTIINANNILDFCISQKAGGNFLLEFHKNNEIQYLQKTNRFYISKDGGKIIKRNKNTNKELGLFVNENTTILNDYDKEIPFDNYNIDFDFYIKEAHKYIDEIENSSEFEELKQEKLGNITSTVNNSTSDTSKIKIKPARFRFSEGAYSYDINNNVVYRGINSIKYITNNSASELYNLRNNNYDTFIDLLVDIEENTNVNKRQIEILIKLNYFEEFGYNKRLLYIFEEFSKGKNKYTKLLKDKTKEKRLDLLKQIENNHPNEKLSPMQQFDFEQEITGAIYTTYPQLDKKYIYVLKLDEKYAPRISAYCLNSGTITTLKIQRKIFEENNFLAGDILYCKQFKKKPSVKFIAGNYEEIPNEFTWWVENFDIISNNDIEKLLNSS